MAVTIRVLTYPDPPAEKIARAEGAAYRLSLTRFSQGEGLTCPPFRLNIDYDRQADLTRRVLSAEQADDVVIAQTPSTLYIFYSELVLDGFGGWIANTSDAKPLLCDINIPVCAREMRQLAHAGTQMQRICGSDDKWRRP